MRRFLAGLVLMALAPALGALADRTATPQSPPWALTYLGRWSLYEDGEGGQGCTLTLGPGMAIGGSPLAMSPTCRQLFPVEDVSAWTIGDAKSKRPHILFIGPLRETILDFAPFKDLPWSASLPPRDGLERPQALLEPDHGPAPQRSVSQLFAGVGSFDLSGPNMKDWCGFAIKATGPAGGALEQEGRCAQRWKGKAWAAWTWTKGKLLLKDRRGAVVLTLTRGDKVTFVGGTPEDPLFLGPGVIQMS